MKITKFAIAGAAILAMAAACGGAGAKVSENSATGDASDGSDGEGRGNDGTASGAVRADGGKAVCPELNESDRPWILNEELSDKLQASVTGDNGLVLVKYSDCGIELLKGCGVGSGYSFNRTRRTKVVEIVYHLDEMYTQLPFDARRLEAEFNKGGVWSLQAAVVGDHETSTESLGRDQIGAGCARATHFLKSVSVGAYRLEVMKKQDDGSDKTLLMKEGAFERCLLSETDASSPACGNAVRIKLRPIEMKSAIPPSDKHFLLDQPPGSDRGRRVEPNRMGEMIDVPEPGKTTAVLFWGAACELCPEDEADEEAEGSTAVREKNKKKKKAKKKDKKAAVDEGEEACVSCEEDPVWEASKRIMGVMEQIWKKTDRKKVQVVGVAADMDGFKVRERLGDLQVTFPMISDGETGKLKSRFHVEQGLPAVFVIDSKGYVRFYSDCSSDDAQKIVKAVAAVSGD